MDYSDQLVKMAKFTALFIWAFVLPVVPLVVALVTLVIMDNISGYVVARKRGDRWRSSGMRRSWNKGLLYGVGILTTLILERTIAPNDTVPIAKAAALGCLLIEAKSIYENIELFLGRKIFSSVLERISPPTDKSDILKKDQ